MQIYSGSEARRKLGSVLDEADSIGKVFIRRRDGRTYALVPQGTPTSPLDIPSISANISTQEIVSLVRQERGSSRGLKSLG